MADRPTAQSPQAIGTDDRPVTAAPREGDRWEVVRRDVAALPRNRPGPDDDGTMALWTAALCLCLRRYGAPKYAGLTILTGDRGEKTASNHRIELSFADSMPAGAWLDVVRSSLRSAGAREKTPMPADEPGPLDGWRVGLVIDSDLPPTGHEIFSACDRVFAVRFSSGTLGVSAARKQARRTEDWPLAQMLAHWEQLAAGIVETPETPVCRLPVLTASEMDSIIRGYEKPRDAIAHPRFGFELFDDQVALTPDAPAVTDGEKTITYQELAHRSNRLAHYLQKLGVGPETIVGVFLDRSIDLVVAVIGLQKAGGGYLPIDPGYPRGRLEYLISDSRVSVIITNTHLAPRLPPGNYRAVQVDRESGAIAAMSAGSPVHGLKPGNMAFVFYTSGSTGQPKGVIMQHVVRGPFDRSRIEPDNLAVGEKALLKSAVGFTLILREIFWPLHWGGHLVVVPQGRDGDSAHLVRVLREHRVVGANFVPSMLSLIVEEPDLEHCTSLRLIYTVGESLAVEVQRRLFARLPGVRLFVFYGCTEAPAATFRECRPDEPYGNRIVIGKPMANKKVYLLDRNLLPVPPGVAGEIHTGGSISRGYLHRPELTADRFIPNPFSKQPGERLYRTGDLARWLPDGNLEFLGRADFQVQVRGIRVELGEIEAVIATHPAIKEVLVMADPRSAEQTRLIAYYTDREGQRAPLAELRSLLRAQLPEYMMPTSFTRLEVFPLNANGKIDRRGLPAPETATAEPDRPLVVPRTANEVRLAGIWARILGVNRLSVTDRFFDIGGDSMLAARLVARINRECGTALSLPDFYREPTIAAVAQLLFGDRNGTGLQLFLPITTGGTRPPVFMTNPYPLLARHFGPEQPYYGMKGHWLDAHFDYRQDVPATVQAYLRELRQIQPHGPYMIFGFSFGGLFALEMAHQLEQAGEIIGCLLLLDPTLPDDDEPDSDTGPADSVAGATSSSAAPRPGRASPAVWWRRHRAALRGLSAGQKFAYIAARFGTFVNLAQRYWAWQQLTLGRGFNAIGLSIPFSLRQTVATHYYAHIRRAYRPAPLRTRAIVYLLKRHAADRRQVLEGLFPSGLEVRLLDTNRHLDVMNEPHLSQWMDELKRILGGPSSPVPAPSTDAADGSLEPGAISASALDQPDRYHVVCNAEGQFSTWPIDWLLPPGWSSTGFQGDRVACLAHISHLWTEPRPVSLR